MKTTLVLLAAILTLAASIPAQAESSACGGVIQYSPDCSNNDRDYTISCCPEGYRAQGVAYTDIKGQDHVDAVSVVCRSISRGNDMMPSDFSRRPGQYVCEKSEVLAGVFQKDVKTDGGNRRDTLDGVTAVCQHPGQSSLRKIYNQDIQGGRGGGEQTVLLPKRVVGIAYKELDKGSSDRADCVTIITK